MRKLLFVLLAVLACAVSAQEAERKVLRLLFASGETSFDPARISDLYSRAVTTHIFEAPYEYDYLARPTRVRPLTAAGMPEVSSDFRTWIVRIQPGIYFADDPVFKGRRRELVAQDYVYAFQRVVDPANISPIEANVIDLKIKGLAAARDAAVKGKKPFDYDAPIEGLRAIERHTLRIELEEPRPRFIDALVQSDLLGGQAREVVEHYKEAIGEHPVGTGPFKLKSWRRHSRIVLERNPGYREVLYDAWPAADDAEGQAMVAKLKGRRLPLIDEVDVSVIEEFQPQWLSFLNKEIDALATS
ncbi:MAG TPA: ABC transporter substrate-binding protein, partial [Burkholderiaceae bacterium]|nr:ABC transporter substrate-binding protein [Burkholderiaceae bacterium]